RVLTRLLVLPCTHDGIKDLEILVLRQQLRVLRRKSGRPKFTACDRVLLAAASRVLPRARWVSSSLVTPQTLLRWRRALVHNASGPTGRRARLADHRSTRRSRTSSFGWPGRTLGEAAYGSAGSCASSVSEWAPRPSGGCCVAQAWARRPDGSDPPGRSSSEPKPMGSWPVTSSRWGHSA